MLHERKIRKLGLKLIIRYPLRSTLHGSIITLGTSILVNDTFPPHSKTDENKKNTTINMKKICFLHCLREIFNNCLSMCQKQILCQLVWVILSSIVLIKVTTNYNPFGLWRTAYFFTPYHLDVNLLFSCVCIQILKWTNW